MRYSEPVELDEKRPELLEPLRAELLRPLGLDLGDRLADHSCDSVTTLRHRDAPRPQVVRVGETLDVPEALELAEQVVERLLAHPQPRGQVGGPEPLRAGVLEHDQVWRREIVEAALVEAFQHPLADGLERHPEEGTDQRRAVVRRIRPVRKST